MQPVIASTAGGISSFTESCLTHCAICLLVLMCLGCDRSGPRVELSTHVLDLGRGYPDQPLEGELALRNVGNETLVFEEPKAGSAWSIELSPLAVVPGGEARLKVSVVPNSTRRTYRFVLPLRCNDPNRPVVRIELRAERIDPVDGFQPIAPEVQLPVEPGQTVRGQLRLVPKPGITLLRYEPDEVRKIPGLTWQVTGKQTLTLEYTWECENANALDGTETLYLRIWYRTEDGKELRSDLLIPFRPRLIEPPVRVPRVVPALEVEDGLWRAIVYVAFRDESMRLRQVQVGKPWVVRQRDNQGRVVKCVIEASAPDGGMPPAADVLLFVEGTDEPYRVRVQPLPEHPDTSK